MKGCTKTAIKGIALFEGETSLWHWECLVLCVKHWGWEGGSGYQRLPALSFSLPLLYFSPCGSCLLWAMFLVQQFLNGHISVWEDLGSCAHPILWSVHGDKVSSALARTEGRLHNSESCSVWEVQLRFTFSVLAKLFWGPGKGNQIHTKTPWSSWNSQVFCDLSSSILNQKILALCYLIWK